MGVLNNAAVPAPELRQAGQRRSLSSPKRPPADRLPLGHVPRFLRALRSPKWLPPFLREASGQDLAHFFKRFFIFSCAGFWHSLVKGRR